jgi:hypothetical protein
MIIATFGDNGIVLGLSEENIKLLIQGHPIRVTRKTHNVPILGEMQISIFYGKTEDSILKDFIKHGLATVHTDFIMPSRSEDDKKDKSNKG